MCIRDSCYDRLVSDCATPAKNEVENNGQTIKPTRQQQLKSNADNRRQPDTDEEADRNKVAPHLPDERRVSSSNHHIDGGVIEAAQNPFRAGDWPCVVSGRETSVSYTHLTLPTIYSV